MANGMSLRPSTFSAGGSLLDDVDVTFERVRFVRYDFEGKSEGGEKLCILAVLKDGDGNDHPQYWSAGDLAYFVPSENPKNADENGITCVQVGEKTSLNGGTNAAIMLNSLVQAGFPEDKLDEGDLRVLEGMKAHVNRVPQPKRNNLPKKEGQRDPMVLVVTSIVSMPGEAAPKGKSTAAATKPNGKAAPAAAASNGAATDAMAEELTGELIGLFAEKGVTEMKKVEISKNLFASIDKTNPNRNKLISLAAKDDVLKGLEGFSYNGSVLTQE